MTTLHEVIYVSDRATGLSDHTIIDEIVLPSGNKNRRLDITGCLWFSKNRFLQILEGPREAVEGVYSAILRDNRHTNIQTISSSPVTNRSFSRWGMRAFKGDEGVELELIIDRYASGKSVSHDEESPEQSGPSLLDQIRNSLVMFASAERVTQ